MGQIIRASCPCGYKEPILKIGGGMMSFTTRCSFPAYCSAGKPHVVTVNLYDKPLKCTHHKKPPIPYNDLSLIGKKGRVIRVSTRIGPLGDDGHYTIFELTSGTYLCPACQNFTLKFSAPYVCFD